MNKLYSIIAFIVTQLIGISSGFAVDEYYVYSEKFDNGSPSGIMGTANGNSLTIDPSFKEAPLKGENCLKITASGTEGWCGVFVQQGNTWREGIDPSIPLANLTGKKYFIINARADDKYTIAKLGMGEGKEPTKGEGKVAVSKEWKRFVFELPAGDLSRVNGLLLVVFEGAGTIYLDEVFYAGTDFIPAATDVVYQERKEALDPTSFYVFADKFENGVPSGYMGEKDGKSIKFNDNYGDNPYLGTKCIKIEVDNSETWRGLYILYTGSWNATLTETAKLADLSSYDKFEFYARADVKGSDLYILSEIGIGAGDGREDQRKETFIEVGSKWKKYTVNLKGVDLKTVNSLFFMVLPVGTLYLDEIRFLKRKEK